MARRRANAQVRVDANVHENAKRSNIPTAELEAFAEQGQKRPKTLLYPRDPSLDPQLVWKGKDEQDLSDLAVPSVPIYIQEKIHPRFLIEELRAESTRTAAEEQTALFGDFNGLEFEKLVDFYQHPMKWQNRMILGDSLLVMGSLADKEGLKGKVQMIYLDPPYGIKFGSNWQVSTRDRDVTDGKADDATRQPEQIKAFRDTWELGIHSYLSYLRDRLAVARDLLAGTGSIFVQMGEQNVHLVRSVMDEIFGSNNAVVTIVFRTTANLFGNYLGRNSDYLLWYARDIELLKMRKLFKPRSLADDVGFRYTRVELADGTRRSMTDEERADESRIPHDARPYRHDNLASQGATQTGTLAFMFEGRDYHPGSSRHWKTTADGLTRLAWANRLAPPTPNSLQYVRFLDDFPVAELSNVWTDTTTGAFTDDKVYVVQTNTKVIERCVLMATDPGDLVLDPTCGAGTTAYVAEQWGRRWITVDTSRVAMALARTRLMAARYPYYVLADSAAGQAKEAELASHLPDINVAPTGDVSKGFIYERVPHVMLKSIANNPDIKAGMSRAEIAVATARHAENEILYNRPYTDARIIRVAGPFTVESLSPHRGMPELDKAPTPGTPDSDPAPFIDRILQNLRKAGVQNAVKAERLVFDRLDPWPGGVYVQATGEYEELGQTKTVAICVGPEYGTVGPELVREAAKEAAKLADLLVICGFAFEAHVGDEGTRLGKLTILKAKMNPDLSMGDELLKKTGAANLFMVFGEPDILIMPGADNDMTVEIRGLDVYNPTTGEIRSDSVDEIACWFIDTNYNAESFFVRHAYFLGGGDPYGSLKKALRSEIDEAAWSSLYSPKSRPFPKPPTGKIAIKVINHYGDEVLKVYSVG